MGHRFFNARAQIIVGYATFGIGSMLWVLGIFVIPGAKTWPWDWQPVAYVFHVSMFFGLVACYAIIATAVGIRKTEVVQAQVADVEHADKVEVGRS